MCDDKNEQNTQMTRLARERHRDVVYRDEVGDALSGAQRTILDEVIDQDSIGVHTGQVKWFNDKLGYGFITICGEGHGMGNEASRDVFIHHSGVRPLNSSFHSLRKGEYISFNMTHGLNGPQAIDVTGIGGGTLMCDVSPYRRFQNIERGRGNLWKWT